LAVDFYCGTLHAHGLTMRKLFIRLSLSLSNAWIVTKRKKVLPGFYTIRKNVIIVFQHTNGWWGRPLLPEILGQIDPLIEKMAISNRYLLVAPQL